MSAKNLLFLDSREILLLFTSHVPQLNSRAFVWYNYTGKWICPADNKSTKIRKQKLSPITNLDITMEVVSSQEVL